MLCVIPVLRGCVWYVCCYVRKKALLQKALLQCLRGGSICACMRCPCLCQLPYVWHYVVVKSSFKHDREECESKRAYEF